MPDTVRTAVLQDVELSVQDAADADVKSKIRIHLALEQGITTRELEERLGVPQTTISRWSRQGREALAKRGKGAHHGEPEGDPSLGEDPLRPEERAVLG